jgi:hypothetical protein
MEKMGNVYKILLEKPEGKRRFRRHRRRWRDNIKIDRTEKRFGVWIGFIWLRIWTGGGLLSTR